MVRAGDSKFYNRVAGCRLQDYGHDRVYRLSNGTNVTCFQPFFVPELTRIAGNVILAQNAVTQRSHHTVVGYNR